MDNNKIMKKILNSLSKSEFLGLFIILYSGSLMTNYNLISWQFWVFIVPMYTIGTTMIRRSGEAIGFKKAYSEFNKKNEV
jgi:hypothetical protein